MSYNNWLKLIALLFLELLKKSC